VTSSPASATSVLERPRPRSERAAKRFGSEVPRVWTPPLRPLTEKTTLGFECIRFAEDILDVALMPWQKWFLKAALELHPTEVGEDGAPLFRFRKVLLLVGRQNGKSTVMQVLTLWRMFVDRCGLVIGTAQDLEIAEALLRESYELAEEAEDLAPELGPLMRGAGKMSFRLKSGETYKVKAASRRGGRGLSGELVLLDELREHQSWDSWGAVTKTTNARERAQIYGISNAGDASSIVLRHLRKMAHARLGDPDGLSGDDTLPSIDEDDVDLDADDDSLGIFEWSAAPKCGLLDRDAWAMGNPALGHRIREATLASDAATDPEWVFRTEVLCQWSDGTLEGPFPPGSWDACGVGAESKIVGNVKVGVDVSVDRTHAHIAVAGRTADGSPQVELVATNLPIDAILPWLQDEKRKDIIEAVTAQLRGAPVSSLIPDWVAAGVPYTDWAGQDVPNGTGNFYDLVRTGGLKHTAPNPPLDIAAATAVPKMTDGGAFMWDRKRSATDIAPLIAATGAIWLLTLHDEVPKRSKYEDADLLVV
jgi:hypothetical protein